MKSSIGEFCMKQIYDKRKGSYASQLKRAKAQNKTMEDYYNKAKKALTTSTLAFESKLKVHLISEKFNFNKTIGTIVSSDDSQKSVEELLRVRQEMHVQKVEKRLRDEFKHQNSLQIQIVTDYENREQEIEDLKQLIKQSKESKHKHSEPTKELTK